MGEEVEARKELETLLALPANSVCCDCTTEGPKWASLTIGCFICIRCSGVHRSLGTHISRIRSIELDSWTLDNVKALREKGNRAVNLIYEARLSSNIAKPTANTPFLDVEAYITQKYVDGRFKTPEAGGGMDQSVKRGTVFTSPTILPRNNRDVIEKDKGEESDSDETGSAIIRAKSYDSNNTNAAHSTQTTYQPSTEVKLKKSLSFDASPHVETIPAIPSSPARSGLVFNGDLSGFRGGRQTPMERHTKSEGSGDENCASPQGSSLKSPISSTKKQLMERKKKLEEEKRQWEEFEKSTGTNADADELRKQQKDERKRMMAEAKMRKKERAHTENQTLKGDKSTKANRVKGSRVDGWAGLLAPLREQSIAASRIGGTASRPNIYAPPPSPIGPPSAGTLVTEVGNGLVVPRGGAPISGVYPQVPHHSTDEDDSETDSVPNSPERTSLSSSMKDSGDHNSSRRVVIIEGEREASGGMKLDLSNLQSGYDSTSSSPFASAEPSPHNLSTEKTPPLRRKESGSTISPGPSPRVLNISPRHIKTITKEEREKEKEVVQKWEVLGQELGHSGGAEDLRRQQKEERKRMLAEARQSKKARKKNEKKESEVEASWKKLEEVGREIGMEGVTAEALSRSQKEERKRMMAEAKNSKKRKEEKRKVLRQLRDNHSSSSAPEIDYSVLDRVDSVREIRKRLSEDYGVEDSTMKQKHKVSNEIRDYYSIISRGTMKQSDKLSAQLKSKLRFSEKERDREKDNNKEKKKDKKKPKSNNNKSADLVHQHHGDAEADDDDDDEEEEVLSPEEERARAEGRAARLKAMKELIENSRYATLPNSAPSTNGGGLSQHLNGDINQHPAMSGSG